MHSSSSMPVVAELATLRVAEIMSAPVHVAGIDATLGELASRMAALRCSVLALVDAGRAVGIVSESDLARHFRDGTPLDTPAGSLRERAAVSVDPETGVITALESMREADTRALLVIDPQGELRGILTETDVRARLGDVLVRALGDLRNSFDALLPLLAPTDTLWRAVELMGETGLDYVIVVEDGTPVGILTERDLPKLMGSASTSRLEPLAALMSRSIHAVPLSAALADVVDAMGAHGLRHVLVTRDDGSLAGVVSQHRVLSRLPLGLMIEMQARQLRSRESEAGLRQRLTAIRQAVDIAEWEFEAETGRFLHGMGVLQILGYRPDLRVLNTGGMLELMYPADRVRFEQARMQLLEAQTEVIDVECRVRRADGRWAWLLLRGRLVEAAGTKAAVVGGVAMDVTARRYEELILQAQERLLRAVDAELELEPLLQILLDALSDLPEVDAGGIYWRDAAGGYDLLVHRGLGEAFIESVRRVEPGSERACRIEAGEMVCSCTAPAAPAHGAHAPLNCSCSASCHMPGLLRAADVLAEGISAIAVVPIVIDGVAEACLNLASHHVPVWSARLVESFGLLARHFGQALKRLRAEQSAARQHRELAGLLENLADGIFVTTLEGTLLHYNRAIAAGLGHGDALLGRPVIELHPPEYTARAAEIGSRVLAQGEAVCHFPLRCADGSRRAAETRIVRGSWQGRPALIGIVRDTSERDRREEELRAQKELADALIESLPGIFYIIDGAGRLRRWNRLAEQVTGLGAEELRGTSMTRFFDADDIPRIVASQREVLEHGESSIEATVVRSDGTRIAYSFRGRGITIDGERHNIGIGFDISVEQAVRAERDAERLRLETLIATMPDAFWMKDVEGRYQVCNSAASRFAGSAAADMVGRTDRELFSDEAASVIESSDRAALFADDFVRAESVFVLPGQPQGIRLDIIRSPVIDAEGRRIGVLGVARDITAVRATEQALQERNRELRCLFNVFRLTEAPGQDIEAMLQSVAAELPSGFREAIGAQARIRFDGQAYVGGAFADEAGMLCVGFDAEGEAGDICIAGTAPPDGADHTGFLANERELLETVAMRIGRILGRERLIRRQATREQMFTALVEQAHDWMGFIDARSGDLLEYNDATRAGLGYTREEFARLTVGDIEAVRTPAQLEEDFARIRAAGGAVVETRYRRKDGELRDVRVSLRYLEFGGRGMFATVVTDLTETRQALASLRKSEEDLRRAQEVARIGSWSLDLRTQQLEVSEQTRRMFGTAVEKLADRETAREYVPAEDREFIDAQWRRAATQPVLEFDHRILVEGSLKWARQRARVEYDADGRPAFITGTIQDITEQHAAEELLRQLSAAVEQSTNAILITDRSGSIEYVNDAFAQATGYAVDEAVGRNPRMLKSGLTPPAVYVGMWSELLAGRSWRGEFVNRRKDGSTYPVRAQLLPIRSAKGAVERYLAVEEDITGQMRAEDEIRKLLIAVEQSPTAIVITDLEARIEYVNAAFEHTTGYAREEVLGRNPSLLHADKPSPQAGRELWDTLVAGRTWRGEFANRRKSGEALIEAATIAPLRDAGGRITHYVAVKEDVTERRRIDAELEQHRHHLMELVEQRTAELAEARARAEAASQAKSAFLANMSHEIRTPMNAITGLTNLMARDQGLGAGQRDRLDKIRNAAQHLLGIINDILDLSKIEAGRMQLESRPFDLGDAVAKACEVFETRAREKGLAVERSVDPALPHWVEGDALRITQVLMNFGSNAVKFTERGHVACNILECGRGADGTPRVRFEVVDSGIGMSEEQVARLFQAFEQADASTTRRYGGTGLGLAISRRLVELMGGEIGVQSSVGEGSVFWFEIPLRGARQPAVEAGAAVADAAEPAVASKRARLLLVEDDPINREVALWLLEERDCEVECAVDGAEALERARAVLFDLVLMDMHMPVMDGLEATRALRRDPRYARTPIIALTASAFTDDRQRCLDAGMDAVVTKPVQPDELFAVLDRWTREAPAVPAPARAAAATAPLLADVPGLDVAHGLRLLNGHADTHQRMLRDYASRRAAAGADLGAALASGDLAGARRLAHTLAGVAGTIGALEVQLHAARLDRALREQQPDAELQVLLGEFARVNARFVEDLALALPREATAAAVTVDRATGERLLAELRQQLATDDAAAAGFWREYAGALAGVTGEAAPAIAGAIARYDFEDALALLDLARARAAQPAGEDASE